MTSMNYCLACGTLRGGVMILRLTRTYTLGRAEDCDIHLPSTKVSRHHANLYWSETKKGWFIEDLRSRNGTRVGGVRIKLPTLLRDGDVIDINPFDLRFRTYSGQLEELVDEVDVSKGETHRIEVDKPPKPFFSGKFSGTDLIELCQFLSFNHKTGLLMVFSRSGEMRGHILMLEGAIGHAKDKRGTGREAVLRLLSLRAGNFEFRSPVPPEISERFEREAINTEQVLFDVSRMMDENTRGWHDPESETGLLDRVPDSG